jgi:hypothetical protein
MLRDYCRLRDFQAAGTAVPSFASTHLANADLTADEEHVIKMTSMAIYGGGTDTVSICTLIFF